MLAISLFTLLWSQKRPEVIDSRRHMVINENEEYFKDTAMDVYIPELSKGKCIILKLPGEEWVLIDCGSSEDFPAVYESLRNLGVHIIDFIVFTSSKESSLGGTDKILSNFEVCRIYCSADMENTKEYDRLKLLSLQNDVILSLTDEGARLYDFDDVCIDVVCREKYSLGKEVNSISMYIIYGKRALFVKGECDIETEAKMAAELKNSIESDILIMSDVNMATAHSRYFIEEVNADFLAIPAYEVEAVGEEVGENCPGAEILRTDLNGDIAFNISEKEVKVKIER